MVRIDDVYQKVLALSNKEQRGYITPQDFNLFANQAQLEIFEQYFYDINIARKSEGNNTVFADVDDILEEKLQIFEERDDASSYTIGLNGGLILPNHIYRVDRIERNGINCELLNTKDFRECTNGTPLLRPSNARPVCNIRSGEIRCFGNSATNPTNIFYFKVPLQVNWTYVVINKQAMYDANISTQDFELHNSEENNLVNKILMLAGLAIQQPDVMQAAQAVDMQTRQQQPKV
jgi:hypothetical protein